MSAAYPTEGLIDASPGDLAWMSGVWRGFNGDDLVEEYWSDLRGDALMGMFRWISGDRVKFYELAAIERCDAFVHLRIKHFNRGLVGWEEKDQALDLRLVYARNGEAAFMETQAVSPRWAVYKRESENRMLSYFTQQSKEPLAEPGVFDYVRQKAF